MTDLVLLMSKLVDSKGKILIPGVYDDVAKVTGNPLFSLSGRCTFVEKNIMTPIPSIESTACEDKLYEVLDFSMADIYNAVGAKNTISDIEKETLMAR